MDDKELKEKIQKESTDFLQSANIESLIVNNVIEFNIEEVKYRVTRPSFAQKQLTLRERNKKFISLLKDSNNIMEKDLITLYAQRNISVADMDNKYKTLQTQREGYEKKLGQALADKKPEEDLLVFKNEILTIISEQNRLLAEKSVLLESSLESQLQVYVYTYLASLVTEKYLVGADLGNGSKEPDPGWVHAWSNYDEFIKEHESTVNIVVWYSSIVSKNELSGL